MRYSNSSSGIGALDWYEIHYGRHLRADGVRFFADDKQKRKVANTALPQPPSTNQNVPMNSAASRCDIVGSRMTCPITSALISPSLRNNVRHPREQAKDQG